MTVSDEDYANHHATANGHGLQQHAADLHEPMTSSTTLNGLGKSDKTKKNKKKRRFGRQRYDRVGESAQEGEDDWNYDEDGEEYEDGDDDVDDGNNEENGGGVIAMTKRRGHEPLRSSEDENGEGPCVIDIDAAIDQLGTGCFQVWVLFAGGLCFASDAIQVMMLSFLTIVLEDEWGLTDVETASITSSLFAGAMLGTLILGPLGDAWGRRPVFVLAGLIISLAGFVSSFVPNYTTLLVAIFVVGFGVGGATVPFDVLAEFLPTDTRGKYLLRIEYFWTAGNMAVPLMAYLTVGMGLSWRVFVFLCAVPCFSSVILGLALVPESPRWLLGQGRTTEALQVLRKAAKANGKDPLALFPQDCELKMEEEEESTLFTDLVKPKWRKLTFLIWSVWAGFSFAYYGTIMVVTNIFEDDEVEGGGIPHVCNTTDHMSNATDILSAASNCTDVGLDEALGISKVEYHFKYGEIFISSSAELVAIIAIINMVDQVGRIPLQVWAYTVGGITLTALCFLGAARRDGLVVFSDTPLLTVAFVARICEMMGSCVTWVVTAEVLSTEIRTTGHAAANAIARVGGFVVPYIVDDWKLEQVGIFMLVVHLMTAFFSWRLPETRGKAMGQAGEEFAAAHGFGQKDALDLRQEPHRRPLPLVAEEDHDIL